MPNAAILIDDKDGVITVVPDFDGQPFDPACLAHQTAAQLLKHLGTIAQRVPPEPAIKPALLLGPNGMPMLQDDSPAA